MDRALLRRFRRRHNGGSVGHVSTALRLALVAVAIAPLAVLAVAAALAVGGLAIYSSYAQELPSAEEIRRLSVDTFETTRLYDRTGQHVLFEIMPQRMDQGKRTWVPLSRIPEHLRNGTIAAEDKTFYTNPAGINVEGLARAVVGLVRGEYAGGGSSITQQLARNVIMPLSERLERSETRKIKELILSVELTRRYPGMEGRDQILEWYLNNVYYGRWAYGPEAAAQAYFGKHAEELTLAECAMLVPLGNLPTLLWEGDGLRYAWERDADLKRRQELVLTMMAEQGYITAAEAEAAKREAVVIAPLQVEMAAPHFVVYVRDILEKRYGREAVYGGGLQVITSIDLGIQAKAEELARKQIAAIRQERNAHNAAVVVLNTKTAEILAMVGSVDYNDLVIKGNINMAVTPRQPGSSFKPFVYATAFAQGYTPATMVMDVRTSFPDPSGGLPYVPENYSRSFRGPILLRQALGCSYNVPAVAVCQLVGPQKAVETARATGISTLQAFVGGQVKRNLPADEYGLSVALGGYEITLLDMTYGFTVFANGGTMLGTPLQGEEPKPGFRRLDPVSVLRVTDAKGRLIDQYTEPQRQEVIRPEVAFLINDVLSDNQARTAAFGANSFMVIPDRPAAVKTGTTNEYRDGWAIGYTPQYAVGVWVGNAHNNEPMKNTPGVRAAGPIFQALMTHLHEGLPVESFTRPAGIETAVVDGTSGKRPTEYSPWRMQEVFIAGTVPTEPDDVHRPYRICQVTGKLATPHCPPQDTQTVVFEIFPPEAGDWVREQGIPQPPREYCDVHGPNLANAEVAITKPRLFEIVRGVVPVVGNAKPGGLQRFQLQFGDGMDPQQWYPIGPEHGHRVDNGVLEHWDTTGLDGLYTLRLSVLDGGNQRYAPVQVIVDNTPPSATILNPAPQAREPGAPPSDPVYVEGDDEWIHIQVFAQDNTSMKGVAFYMDNELLGVSTVAPYTMRWTLKLANVAPTYSFSAPPAVSVSGDRVERTEVYTAGASLVYSHTIQQGEAVTATQVIRSLEGLSYHMSWPSGRAITSNALGYTETHRIHVIAYDTAGNEQKSDPVTVQVARKRAEKKQ